jgi:hypothetical protein
MMAYRLTTRQILRLALQESRLTQPLIAYWRLNTHLNPYSAVYTG